MLATQTQPRATVRMHRFVTEVGDPTFLAPPEAFEASFKKLDAHSPLPVILGIAALVGCGIVITRLFKAGQDVSRKVQRKPFQVSAQGIQLHNGALIAPSQIYAIRRGNTQTGHSVVVGGVSSLA